MKSNVSSLTIGGQKVLPGETCQIEVPIVRLYTNTDIHIPAHVIRSTKPGPTVFVSAAIHGDELNGIEIVRRLIQLKSFRLSKGSLILVPMVNVYGVLDHSRYMPDRRDLNRSFPGSAKGSLSSIVANTFLTEIVKQCQYGIDLHTGAIHRSNLPQIRANLNDSETLELAQAFGAPVLLDAGLRDGSLRGSAADCGIRVLLYEAGEALRFDELSIRAGVRGVQNVLSSLGMVTRKSRNRASSVSIVAKTSSWIRANASGIVTSLKNLGDRVEKGDELAKIGDPYGSGLTTVKARRPGIVIGKQNIPLVQQGDAMFHIAYFSDQEKSRASNMQPMEGHR